MAWKPSTKTKKKKKSFIASICSDHLEHPEIDTKTF